MRWGPKIIRPKCSGRLNDFNPLWHISGVSDMFWWIKGPLTKPLFSGGHELSTCPNGKVFTISIGLAGFLLSGKTMSAGYLPKHEKWRLEEVVLFSYLCPSFLGGLVFAFLYPSFSQAHLKLSHRGKGYHSKPSHGKPPALNGDHVVRSLDEPVSPRLQKRRKAGKVARLRYWWPGEIPFDWIWRFVSCNSCWLFEEMSRKGISTFAWCAPFFFNINMSTLYNPLRPGFLMTFRQRKATSSYRHPFRTEKKTCFCLNRFVQMYILHFSLWLICVRKENIYMYTYRHCIPFLHYMTFMTLQHITQIKHISDIYLDTFRNSDGKCNPLEDWPLQVWFLTLCF